MMTDAQHNLLQQKILDVCNSMVDAEDKLIELGYKITDQGGTRALKTMIESMLEIAPVFVSEKGNEYRLDRICKKAWARVFAEDEGQL